MAFPHWKRDRGGEWRCQAYSETPASKLAMHQGRVLTPALSSPQNCSSSFPGPELRGGS